MAFTWFPFPPGPPTFGLSSSWHDLALACEIYAVWQQTKYSQHTHTHTRTLRATHNILLFPTFSGANTLHLISSASAGRVGNELCRRANSCASTNPGNYGRLRCGGSSKIYGHWYMQAGPNWIPDSRGTFVAFAAGQCVAPMRTRVGLLRAYDLREIFSLFEKMYVLWSLVLGICVKCGLKSQT